MRCEQDDAAVQRELVDALTGMMKQAGAVAQEIAPSFGLTPTDLLALFKLEDGLPMKELATRMGCDASFVTTIADALEKRGLVRREPSQRDRRVKNLRLTPEGVAAKERMTHELGTRMPWNTRLDLPERCCFLSHLKKMVAGSESLGGEAVTPAGRASS
jgi:DNA-binding MarR family transcriptional regulator